MNNDNDNVKELEARLNTAVQQREGMGMLLQKAYAREQEYMVQLALASKSSRTVNLGTWIAVVATLLVVCVTKPAHTFAQDTTTTPSALISFRDELETYCGPSTQPECRRLKYRKQLVGLYERFGDIMSKLSPENLSPLEKITLKEIGVALEEINEETPTPTTRCPHGYIWVVQAEGRGSVRTTAICK